MDYPPTNTALSRAELAVFSMLARGMKCREIAAERGRQFHTVRCQITSLYRKLKVHSRAEAIAVWKQMEAGR